MLRLITPLLTALLSLPANAADIQSVTYPNGLKLIVEEDHAAPVAMVQVWLSVGGRDELPGKTGLAHVFEHMMFKGSDRLKPGDFSERIAAMGGEDNAFTSTDYTAYFESVPAAHVPEVLTLEAERFGHLKLDAAEFAREIEVIKEERRMRTEDDPNSHMIEELSAAALRLHPYRNPVIGWMQDLERLTIDDVRDFYRQHYVAANATVVVVGDVSFAEVEKAVARSFGKLPKRPQSVRFNPVEPAPLGPKRVTVRLPAQLPLLVVVMPVPAWQPGQNDADCAALAVATHILAGGRTARLQREVVEKQRLAFDSGANYDPFAMGLDLWSGYGALGPAQESDKFEAAFWREIERLGREGPSGEELAASKRNLVAAAIFSRDSLYLRAKLIGSFEATGIGAEHRNQWLTHVRKVSADDVKRVVGRWLRPELATSGLLEPEAKR